MSSGSISEKIGGVFKIKMKRTYHQIRLADDEDEAYFFSSKRIKLDHDEDSDSDYVDESENPSGPQAKGATAIFKPGLGSNDIEFTDFSVKMAKPNKFVKEMVPEPLTEEEAFKVLKKFRDEASFFYDTLTREIRSKEKRK